MPFIKDGGVFIPTNKAYELGQLVSVQLTIFDSLESHTIDSTVIWMTPMTVQGRSLPGIGVQFQPDHHAIKEDIEQRLGA